MKTISLTVGLFVLLMTGLSVSAGEKTTILAFGDSITQGGKNFQSYRTLLVPELEKLKFSVEFIGPRKDDASAHAGYGGKSTANLLKVTETIYTEYPADIVLIHSGHNSFSKNKPVPGIIRDTEAIIQTMRSINPDVTILLAQVITAGKLPKYAYIPELNKELAVLAARLNKDDQRVIPVNHAEGFNWEEDTRPDNVHPNESGSKKMATTWLKALTPILSHDK